MTVAKRPMYCMSCSEHGLSLTRRSVCPYVSCVRWLATRQKRRQFVSPPWGQTEACNDVCPIYNSGYLSGFQVRYACFSTHSMTSVMTFMQTFFLPDSFPY